MQTQTSLFDAVDVPSGAINHDGSNQRRAAPPLAPAPRVRRSPTSTNAAENIEPERLSKREQVYLYLVSRGSEGATRKEIASALDMSENTVRPRVVELTDRGPKGDQAPRVVETCAVRNGCAVLVTQGNHVGRR